MPNKRLYRPCKTSSFLLLLAMLCLFWAAASDAQAAKGKDIATYTKQNAPSFFAFEGKTIRFSDLTIQVKEDKKERHYTVSYRNKPVAEGGHLEVRESFPQPGLATLVLTSLAGGSPAYTFFTIHDADKSILMTTLETGGNGENEAGFFDANGRIVFRHWNFDGYAATQGNASLDIYHGVAPWLFRFLVFENGQWRLDRIGEFAAFYKERLAILADKKPATLEDDSTKGIPVAIAYYSVMAGDAQNATLAALSKSLPPAKASLAPTIDKDIQMDITKSAFIENHLLTAKKTPPQATPLAPAAPTPVPPATKQPAPVTAQAAVPADQTTPTAQTTTPEAPAPQEAPASVPPATMQTAPAPATAAPAAPQETAAPQKPEDTTPPALPGFDNGKFKNDAKTSDAAQCAKQFKTPCDIVACLNNRLQFWDDALNARFKVLMGNYSEQRKAALKREEIQWVKAYMALQKNLNMKKTGDCLGKRTSLSGVVEFVKKRARVLQERPSS